MLLNSKKSQKCKMLTLKCFSKLAKRELEDARPSNALKCCQKMAKMEGDEIASTRHHRARLLEFRQIENASSTIDTFLSFSTNLLYPCIYVGKPRVPPRGLALREQLFDETFL